MCIRDRSRAASGPYDAIRFGRQGEAGGLPAPRSRILPRNGRQMPGANPIQWSDGEKSWTTAGVSDNIIEASWLALLDAVYLEIMRARAAHAIPAPVADYS